MPEAVNQLLWGGHYQRELVAVLLLVQWCLGYMAGRTLRRNT